MASYRIYNRTSGADLGVWDGETVDDAVLAMTVDAGYSSREALAEALSTTVDELDADLVIEAVEA